MYQEVPVTLKACGIDTFDRFMAAAKDHLRAEGYSTGCIADVEEIAGDVKDVVSMVKSGKINPA